ncbi:hypothetical protein [uncultured Clostridium sp.]|uniref:hypothetical protein n=1 Tax=uncultured Clostridium sp. TaxID=59620 RepID=UPI00261AFD3E|nr:hypothetical protein [uncultured Clostridium sp.]
MIILNKKGKEFEVKIDSTDIEKVKAEGIWFAEWNKDFNNYLVTNIHSSKQNKKGKSLKQILQNIILNEDINAPIVHINGDTLDNRSENLEVFNRNAINETEAVDKNTIAIILKDKFGNKVSKALISKEDLDTVVNDNYTWVSHKLYGEISVIANTPEGRIQLPILLMNPSKDEYVHHINLNPLDNRRNNLELKTIED